jgi:hypothetical protein
MTLTLGMAAVPLVRVSAQSVAGVQDRDDQNRDHADQDQNRTRTDQYGAQKNQPRGENREGGTYQGENRDGHAYQGENHNDHAYQGENRDDHDNRYANNQYYRMGQTDAERDQRQNKHKKHNHNFKNDDDRQAYESGYNGRWQQQR